MYTHSLKREALGWRSLAKICRLALLVASHRHDAKRWRSSLRRRAATLAGMRQHCGVEGMWLGSDDSRADDAWGDEGMQSTRGAVVDPNLSIYRSFHLRTRQSDLM